MIKRIFVRRFKMSLVSIQQKDLMKYGRILFLQHSARSKPQCNFFDKRIYRAARDKGCEGEDE